MAQKDYNENLFQAIDIIVDKRLKAINYDATKQAEIIDDSNKHLGWYQVKIDGTITCKAHPIDASMEFAAGDKVIVLIPNNDINEQKIILSKYSEEALQGYVYETPMQQMVDITGNLAEGRLEEEESQRGLTANNRNSSLDTFDDSNSDYSWCQVAHLDGPQFPLVGYQYLGVRGDFRTLLSQCVEGDYGLRIILECAPVRQMAPYNGALDALARFKTAALRFINLYMIANKNGGEPKANLWARINDTNESNKQLNNRLLVNIYNAYCEVVDAFTDLRKNTDFTNSLDNTTWSDSDTSLIALLTARQNSAYTLLDAWPMSILYQLEETNNIQLNPTNSNIHYDSATGQYYYVSAGLKHYWKVNPNAGNTIDADTEALIKELGIQIQDLQADITAAKLGIAFLNCYNWLLSICAKDGDDAYISSDADTISYNLTNINELKKFELARANIIKLNEYLLKYNKITKQGSATIAINSASQYNYLKNVTYVSFYLTPEQMTGMIYDCEMAQPQEAVFPIKDLGTIYSIAIDLYQRPNTFFYYNEDNELTLYPYLYKDSLIEVGAINDELIENDWIGAMSVKPLENYDDNTRVPDNIFLDDLYVCAGYIKDAYKEEEAILYTADSDKYSKNSVSLKTISLRWIHKDESGHFNVVQLKKELDAEGKQKLNIAEDYEIHWYQKDYTSVGDKYAGNNWLELKDYKNLLYCEFIPRAEDYQKELIMCVILMGHTPDNQFVVDQVIKSNILTFENETDLAQEKLAETNIKEGLNLICSDKSNGVYYIYDEQFNTTHIATVEKQKLNIVLNNQAVDTAVDINELQSIDYVDEIEWTIPLKNSLVKFYWNNILLSSAIDFTQEPFSTDNYTFTFIYNDTETNAEPIKLSIKSKSAVSGTILKDRLQYTIAKTYNPNAVNNTIFCKVKLPNEVYTLSTKLTFIFGQQSTNGRPYTLIAVPANTEQTALYQDADSTNKTLNYKIHCYDLNNANKDVINDDNVTISVAWHGNNLVTDGTTVSSADGGFCISFQPNQVALNDIHIVDVSVKYNDITLKQQIPIPVGSDNTINNQIFNALQYLYYNTDGSLNYQASQPYTGGPDNSYFGISYKDNNKYYIITQDYTITPVNANIILKASDESIGTVKDSIFYPTGVYYTTPYFNICNFTIVNGNPSIKWTCPIIKQQYRYPYAAVNEWNGESIEIDEEHQNIFTPRLGAGKKNAADNLFSGVLLGEWGSQSSLDSIAAGSTGIYGFRNGEITYAFNDDGTAFLGASGKGRIIFSGDSGIIQSQNYVTNSNGLFIDLTQGKIDMINNAGHIILDTTNNNQLFKVINSANVSLINIGNGNNGYYLQSSNYIANTSGTRINLTDGYLETNSGIFRGSINVNNVFRVESNGNVVATNGYFSGDLTLRSLYKATDESTTASFWNINSDKGTINILQGDSASYRELNLINLKGTQRTSTQQNVAFIKFRVSISIIGTSSQIVLQRTDQQNWSANFIPTLYFQGYSGSGAVSQAKLQINNSKWSNTGFITSESFTNTLQPYLYYGISGATDICSVSIDSEHNIVEIKVVNNNISSAATSFNDITVFGNLMPKDNTYSIGSSGVDQKWDHIYANYLHGTINGNGSSRLVKNNISYLLPAQNIFFDNLQPRSFKFNNIDSMHYHKGFIVDEVCAAAASAGLKPEDCGVLFSTDEKDPNDPNASLCYNDFIALNTWQIQLLKKRVTALEEKIKELEDKLNEN